MMMQIKNKFWKNLLWDSILTTHVLIEKTIPKPKITQYKFIKMSQQQFSLDGSFNEFAPYRMLKNWLKKKSWNV